MTTAANPQPYQNPAWGTSGSNQAWSGPPFWHPASFWHPAGLGRPIVIAAIVFLLVAGHVGRMLFWPIALAGLVFMVATGRIGCRRSRWRQGPGQGQNGNVWQSCMPPWASAWTNWGGGDRTPTPPSSGNHAFDEYRAETLRRLEEEQTEFSGFLDRLRFAKDKAEFDQFMAERRQTPRPPAVPDEPSHG